MFRGLIIIKRIRFQSRPILPLVRLLSSDPHRHDPFHPQQQQQQEKQQQQQHSSQHEPQQHQPAHQPSQSQQQQQQQQQHLALHSSPLKSSSSSSSSSGSHFDSDGPQHTAHILKEEPLEDPWSLRLSHENTFLSWGRNGMISTVAGMATYSFSQGPGLLLLLMGWSYFGVGTAQYLITAHHMRRQLRIGNLHLAWMTFHSLSAFAVWSGAALLFCSVVSFDELEKNEAIPKVFFLPKHLLTNVVGNKTTTNNNNNNTNHQDHGGGGVGGGGGKLDNHNQIRNTVETVERQKDH